MLSPRAKHFIVCWCKNAVLCLGQDFWGTPVSPFLNFRGTFANSGGHTKSIRFLPVKLNAVSGNLCSFLFNLNSKSTVLVQEGVQITVK